MAPRDACDLAIATAREHEATREKADRANARCAGLEDGLRRLTEQVVDLRLSAARVAVIVGAVVGLLSIAGQAAIRVLFP